MKSFAHKLFNCTLFFSAFIGAVLGFVSAQYAAQPAYAQNNPVQNLQQLGSSFGNATTARPRDPRRIAIQIVNIGLLAVGTVLLLLMLYAGFTWWSAGGEPAKVTTAKQTLGRATVGFILIVSSYSILTFVFNNSKLTVPDDFEGTDSVIDVNGNIETIRRGQDNLGIQ